MQTVSLETVATVFERLFVKLRSKGIDEIPFKEDFYWQVPSGSMSDLSQKPDLEVGSLKDDIEFLTSLIQ